jgi:hypothetical protein
MSIGSCIKILDITKPKPTSQEMWNFMFLQWCEWSVCSSGLWHGLIPPHWEMSPGCIWYFIIPVIHEYFQFILNIITASWDFTLLLQCRWGLRSFGLLCVAYFVICLPMFWDSLLVPSPRIKQSKRTDGLSKMLVNNYKHMLRNDSEEWRPNHYCLFLLFLWPLCLCLTSCTCVLRVGILHFLHFCFAQQDMFPLLL